VNKKPPLSVFFISILISGLILAGAMHFGTVQAYTNLSGIISSDTTWTKANSPYSLTGPVTVNNGVNLTVETGVTVKLNEYSIQVNGILCAKGSSANSILFTSESSSSGGITFQSDSNSWNEQTGTGCIIENVILNLTSISINGASPKINKNTINASININAGTPVISQNAIIGDVDAGIEGSPMIYNNSITGGIYCEGGSASTPIILCNNVTDGTSDGQREMQGSQAGVGIKCSGNNAYAADNIVSNCLTGIIASSGAIIERNYVFNNSHGIEIKAFGGPSLIIRNNTISDNGIGIQVGAFYDSASLTIMYNNIYSNRNYNLYMSDGVRKDVNASCNWWGLTVDFRIGYTIYDSANYNYKESEYYDYGLTGVVTFTPFLQRANAEAMPNPQPLPESSSPTASPNQSNNETGFFEIAIGAIIVLVLINILLIVLLLRKRR
jgi:hypothetical protein